MKILIIQFFAVISVIGTQVSGYPQELLMPDGAPMIEDKTTFEDSVASASEMGEDAYDDGDDSDMFMEPDDSEMEQSESRANHENESASISKMDGLESKSEKVEDLGEPTLTPENTPKPRFQIVAENAQIRNGHQQSQEQDPAPATLLTVKSHEPSVSVVATVSQDKDNKEEGITESEASEKNLETDSQNFFPSFAELFSNHRLPYTEHQQQQQQQRYRPNRLLGYFQRDRGNYQAASTQTKEALHPLLGSGNFGVIRGGTYYPEEKENDEYPIDESVYSPYHHGGNGRGRHNYYRNPKPQPVRGGDFFANFRDFADITAPPKSSFSHLSVVYANKNGSHTERVHDQPRNIFETLRMLEEEEFNAVATTTTEVPLKKLSQGKRKLIKIKKYQEDKARKSRMTVEPLLALS